MQQAADQQAARDKLAEEYLAARRAGAEAVLIGQETLEEAVRQGEQLENAERMADETGYKLDKAGRVLRGMTWSGWVANMFSKELKSPDEVAASQEQAHIPAFYEDAPSECRNAAQAVQNYNANLKVLTTCETDEQLETAQMIVDNMYELAKKEVDQLVESMALDNNNNEQISAFVMKLQKDLLGLRSRQEIKRRMQQREQQTQQKEAREKAAYQNSRAALNLGEGGGSKDTSYSAVELGLDASPETQEILKLQNEHLDGLAQNLDELGNIAINLGEATDRQAALVDSLDTKADKILEQSRSVTRRADRWIQNKAWTPAKPTFDGFVSIQHLPSRMFLAVTNGTLILQPVLDYETCVFGVWKRQGSIFGLQSRFNRRWVGQNILGNLECRASSFGRRQEWETEKQWSQGTPLLCASAGWGAGAYIMVKGETVNIATSGTVTSRNADHWILKEAS